MSGPDDGGRFVVTCESSGSARPRKRPYLPFLPIFHDKIRSGEKILTCRSKKYGEPGDIVDSPVGPLRLLAVYRTRLGVVQEHHWQDEGCESPEHFEEIWVMIHPRKGYDAEAATTAHRFEPVQKVPSVEVNEDG